MVTQNMCYYSSGTKKRGRSISSSMETQYLCPNSKKPRVLDYRKSFSSSRDKAYEVMGSVSDGGKKKKGDVGDRFSKNDSKFVREETLKKRFIVKTEELQVVIGRSTDHQKEMQKKKNQILEKNKADGGEKKGDVGFSDNKAARVETLRKRFGRIIVKAEFQVEDKRKDHDKVDSVEMQRKKNQILEKKLKEAEVVAEAESKMELQRKREAAKKALVELERSVKVDDNVRTMKDFAMMLGYPPNCAVYLCNEIGWYGAPVMVHSRRRST